MTLIKTFKLIGASLDWAVAKCEGASADTLESYIDGMREADDGNYSSNWAQGGPIIEREKIGIVFDGFPQGWVANQKTYGPTPLIAALRCYVASKMGDAVDVPEELTK